MNKKLRNAVLALAMLLPLTMNGQNNNDGHQLPQRKSVTFPASDIQYWVGTGSNSAVVIIGWDDNPSGNNFALAWGVHWNGSATAANMLDTIINSITKNTGTERIPQVFADAKSKWEEAYNELTELIGLIDE